MAYLTQQWATFYITISTCICNLLHFLYQCVDFTVHKFVLHLSDNQTHVIYETETTNLHILLIIMWPRHPHSLTMFFTLCVCVLIEMWFIITGNCSIVVKITNVTKSTVGVSWPNDSYQNM